MTDWQPGDLALCVKGGPIPPINARRPPLDGYPNAGSLYTVEKAGVTNFHLNPSSNALWLVDAPRNNCGGRVWAAERFVKVTPGADIKGVEVERKAPKPVKKSEGIVA